MELVKISDFADYRLKSLVNKLHSKKYFGDKNLSIKYVQLIYSFIYSIPFQQKRITINNKYGEFYCTYRPNKHTSYFITFDMRDDLYLIKNIFNNHTVEYPTYISGAK